MRLLQANIEKQRKHREPLRPGRFFFMLSGYEIKYCMLIFAGKWINDKKVKFFSGWICLYIKGVDANVTGG